MSYDIYIYHSTVKEKVGQGLAIDEFEPPFLLEEDVKRFLDRLPGYGYQLEFEDKEHKEFIKTVSDCPIQVHLYTTEIAFSIPYWKNCEEAIFEALQDASVLSDSGSMVIYDPQTGEWASD
jgi:hypothetical protein